jgi:hypothetical protein
MIGILGCFIGLLNIPILLYNKPSSVMILTIPITIVSLLLITINNQQADMQTENKTEKETPNE